MTQWPDDAHSLAKVWAKIAHGTQIVDLCSRGLVPVTKQGLTVFHTTKMKPTELTCSLRYKPTGNQIDSTRLVHIAVISLFMTMRPQAALAYCKGKWTYSPSMFWEMVRVILAPAIDMPPTIAAASAIDNPNVRSYVLRSWYRLRSRLGYEETERVLLAAIKLPWPHGVWTTIICKWMKQLQTPIVITTPPKADLYVGSVPVAVSYKDRIALLLMILFREPLAYGEKYVNNSLSTAMGLDNATTLYDPEPCSLHQDILLAIKHRTQFVETDSVSL